MCQLWRWHVLDFVWGKRFVHLHVMRSWQICCNHWGNVMLLLLIWYIL